MRLLRLLLHLFPAGLQEDRGDELVRHIATDLRRATGPRRAWAWLATAADLVVNAAGAHADVTRADLRDVWRTCRRSTGFAAAVVVVSALGVGAATTAFSLADHVLVRPLPFPNPERLVKLWQDQSSRGYSRMELSPGNYEDWRRQSTAFASVAAYTNTSVNAVTSGGPLRLDATRATPSLFETLGVAAARGRTFVAGDQSAPSPPVVLSDSLWRTVFGAREDILGTSVTLNSTSYVVVGVMPRGFEFPNRDVDAWTPLWFTPDDLADRGNVFLQSIARLRPGTTLAQARSELSAIAAGLARAFPEANEKTGATVIALRDEVSRQARVMLLALAGASAAVLLIACANLASLLLARSVDRQRELAVRVAMGARPRRLARLLLTESVALSAVGGLVGIGLAALAVPVAAALVPTTLPIADAPSLDLRMLGMAALLTCVTGLTFGVLPAWRVGRALGAADLRHGSRVFGARATERMRSGFVVAEVGATVALLVVVGLFLQALWRVQQVDPGFKAAGVLTARTDLPMPAYRATATREQFYRKVLDDVRAMPGVTSAAYTSFLPLVMRGGIWPMKTRTTTAPEDARTASVRWVTPGYFATMGIPLLRGRDVSPADTPTSGAVAVISQSFANLHWPGEDPLGQHVTALFLETTVVGVVGDVRVRGLERESEPQIYFASAQVPDDSALFYAPKDLVVRTAGRLDGLAPAIRAAVSRADPLQPVSDVRTLDAIVERDTESRSTQLSVLMAFAGLAVVLVLVGIHGLLSYVVAARTREIGVRMALGATRSRVLAMVMGRTAVLAGAGLGLGLAAAYAASRSFQALLAGVSPANAATYATAAGVALTVSLAASVLPARRAARIDPQDAMRAE